MKISTTRCLHCSDDVCFGKRKNSFCVNCRPNNNSEFCACYQLYQ